MSRTKYLFAFAALMLCTAEPALAQFPRSYTASELYHELLKANNLASVLYIAAHPDDENTRLISYFENEMKARTAYLSLTRGDGGQNLIGTEIGAAIGVLRTQELLAARRIDGGEQYFTRAVDFGYSKSSLETLDKWDREAVLSDVVWVIRSFRPDVIVTRFPPNNYAGHGHHEASALLAEEAFEAAADPKRFPEQLRQVEVWQPKRLYFNTSSWWNKDLPERARNNDNFLTLNTGEYNALLGETYARIASRSRSEHKSQGFGTDVYYGLNVEYLEYVLGDKASTNEGILEGVDQEWSRIGAPEVGQAMKVAIDGFDPTAPHLSVPAVIQVLRLLAKHQDSPMGRYKKAELEQLLLRLAGLTAEAISDDYYLTPGAEVYIKVNVVHQYPDAITLKSTSSGGSRVDNQLNLRKGDLHSEELKIHIGEDTPFSAPYWLNAPFTYLYEVNDPELLGKAENPPAISATLELEISGYPVSLALGVQHKMVDPAKAVIYRPVNVVPSVTFAFGEEVIVHAGGSAHKVVVYASSHADGTDGTLALNLPKGWSATPASVAHTGVKKGATERYEFTITDDKDARSGTIGLSFEPQNAPQPRTLWHLSEINYDHIPAQIMLKPAEIKLERFELLKGNVARIGYIEGPGDNVAKYLQAAGFDVEMLSIETMQSDKLHSFDAIITGIRAYNTRDDLGYLNGKLNAYVERGGTLLVQYNTSRGVKADQIGPYPFTIGRERVTDEDAAPRLLTPNHPVLNHPNKMTEADFAGWVQERGLYFAADWDKAFTPIIGWHDPEEPERQGALIVAPYGKGVFAYTGISFFRQLPAGVPGAYRLLSNILNLKNNDQTKP